MARNVLFITADQWRGDCLGALGHPCLKTPHLDALAAEGVTFRRHYSNASPCGPSRTSLLTGMYLFNHRQVTNETPVDAARFTNLALEARKAGYAPALFGYTDTAVDPRGRPPADPALRTYEGVMPGFEPQCLMLEDLQPWAMHLRKGGYRVPTPATRIRQTPAGDLSRSALYAAEDSETAFLTGRVLDWLDGQGGRPWFAHVTYIRPHPPWVAPAPYHDMYDSAEVPPPVRGPSLSGEADQHPWLAWKLDRFPTDLWLEGMPLDPRSADETTLARVKAIYYGLMSEVDHHIGRLLAWLRETGQDRDTLIVFTSDHGELMGDHFMFGKYGFHDGAFHIPLIVRDPDGSADATRGRTVSAFTEHVDLMPTLLDWLEQVPPRQCDGRSLLPFLRGQTVAGWRQAAHWEFDFRDVLGQSVERDLGLTSEQCGLAVLRGERRKYVHFTALPPLFFDLELDPNELVNLARDRSRAVEVRDHAQALLSWRMAHAERTLTHLVLTPEGVQGGAV